MTEYQEVPRVRTMTTCGRDGLSPTPLTDNELEGVRRAMRHYKSDELVARLLATIEAAREVGSPAAR